MFKRYFGVTKEFLLSLDDQVLAGVLARTSTDEVAVVLPNLVAARLGLDLGVVTVVQAKMALLPQATQQLLLGRESPWRESLTGRWILAEAWVNAPETRDAALALWNGLVEQSGGLVPEALLGRAQAYRALGDAKRALSDVIACAQRTLDYGVLSKAARLLGRLAARGIEVPGRRIRVGVVGSSTTELFPALLKLLCARDGMSAEIYCGAFGAFRQEILDPQSGLHAFRPDFVVVVMHWRDAALKPVGNPPETAERVIGELRQLWLAAQQLSTCTVLQHAFDFPVDESGGYLASSDASGRSRVLAEINARLYAARVPGVVIVDCPRLAMRVGSANWADDALWHVAKQHPAAPALPSLFDHYARLIAARVGLVRKVLVLDLDNTLWAGVVGEDGPHGIKVGPPSSIGEAHAALQRYALELRQRGIILAVCSKNNEADAREPFRVTLGMVLKETDFVLFVANWEEKSANLLFIARQLKLGIGSLVFVDDNPLERAKVRRDLPEVAVVELPADPAGFVAALDRGNYFEALALSEEDLGRHAAYAANVQRESLKTETTDVAGFLRRLDMRMHHGPFTDAVHNRVVQLLNKTNQFNVTTRRHGSADVTAIQTDANTWTQYFRLVDCFGDNGVVGLIIARPSDSPLVWEIDSFLMSCRVLGRNAEEFMVATLVSAALERGVAQLVGRYLPTPKNGMVADLFPRLGFREVERRPDGSVTFVRGIANQPVPAVDFVRSAGP